jgi:hypothetical protein
VFCNVLAQIMALDVDGSDLGSLELSCLVNFAQSFKYIRDFVPFYSNLARISTTLKGVSSSFQIKRKHHSFQSETSILGI